MYDSILNEEVKKYMGIHPYENDPNEGDGYFLHSLFKSYGRTPVEDAFEFVKELERKETANDVS